jgi:hypothetical protein
LDTGKTGNGLALVEEDQGQDLADAGDRLQAGEALGVMALGRAGDIEFHFAPPLVVVIDERQVQLNGLAHAGLGAVLLDALPVALYDSFLPNSGRLYWLLVF